MPQRTNLLLILALAAGVAYGGFGVPYFLARDSVEEPEEQPLSVAQKIHFRMGLLGPGMDSVQAKKVLGIDHVTAGLIIEYPGEPAFARRLHYRIDQKHDLFLDYDNTFTLCAALLREGDREMAYWSRDQ